MSQSIQATVTQVIQKDVSLQHSETNEIQKGIKLLGLNISESELNELKLGHPISLETRRLSEIGSVLILAEAISALHSVKNITFEDLPKVVIKSSNCSGIPIHCWTSDPFGKCYLILTLTDGKPTIMLSLEREQ